jgi:hypothetical protein
MLVTSMTPCMSAVEEPQTVLQERRSLLVAPGHEVVVDDKRVSVLLREPLGEIIPVRHIEQTRW